jgi:NAD(P)-dependent dehydrogenase (short-subunit alcohol dehydrogenase family)
MNAKQPVALVTGASSGIGKAAALSLVEAGYTVVGTSRKAAKVEPFAGVTFVDLDVADDGSVAAAVKQVIERFGRIDVLVNNAGFGSAGAAEESSIAQDQRVFDINVFGLFRMTKAVLPHMRAQRSGRIVNISSVVGFIPVPYMAVYTASKHAVEGYTESLDHEIREFGIRAVLVEPAWTNTAFEANATVPAQPLAFYDERRSASEQRQAAAIKRGDDPAVVAKAIVAAATDAKPKLRYPAGPMSGRVHTLRRFAPTRIFDQQIRKMNGLPA